MPSTILDSEIEEAEALIQERINQFRSSRGLTVLALNLSLAAVARAHSEDMAESGFFDHRNPEGLGPQDRVEQAAIDNFLCGENLYQFLNDKQNDPEYISEDSFTGWLNSPGHYANIVEPRYDTGGMGIFVKSKIIAGDLSPNRYDIYVTHLLCVDISEYNALKAQYEVAKDIYEEVTEEYEAAKAEYSRIEELHVQNTVPYSDVEAAYESLEEARLRLNEQAAEVNALVNRMNKAAPE